MTPTRTAEKPALPRTVRIFEVGPRDGLQNESKLVSLEDKSWFVSAILEAGVSDIELGAFVRPDRVPQMADTDALCEAIRLQKIKLGKSRAWSLVPNLKGMERAIAAGAKNIAVFTAATDSFAQRNIGMTVAESLKEFKKVIDQAREHSIQVRGYVSTAFGCPFEGKVAPRKALKVVERLAELGVDQLSLGDTIGVATPNQMDQVMKPALAIFGSEGPARVAGHFHDTRGMALANALRSLELGVRVLDSSAGGLGGCPFAPSATGNLPTEDLVYMLNGMGIRTGINLEKLCLASLELARRMGRPLSSRYLQSFAANISAAKNAAKPGASCATDPLSR
jgi:isopropylmalate/homocitrate/citramalate synthase